MSRQFKPGDRVRCIMPECGRGEVGKVVEVDDTISHPYAVMWDEDIVEGKDWMGADELALVEGESE